MSFSQIYLTLMKITGRSMASTVYAASAMLLNYIFIYGKLGVSAMGIHGAALSTCISRLVELTVVIIENRRKRAEGFRFREFIRLKQPLRNDYMRVTIPTFASIMVWAASQFLFSSTVGHLGGDAVAENSLAQITRNLVM